MGYFITIEGIEGSGKSTLRGKLAEIAPRDEIEIVVTREPGATQLGRSIRTLLLDPENLDITPLSEVLLFNADRAQHLQEVVRPALERDALVICDRYVHSTLAYQGYGRGLPMEQLKTLSDFATGGLLPDLVLLLDLDPKEGLERALQRKKRASGVYSLAAKENDLNSDQAWSKFEEQELDFHTRVREGFLQLAAKDPDRFLILPAKDDVETLAAKASDAVRKLLKS
jgi:dTMP kinase